jgi:hypothetical protein
MRSDASSIPRTVIVVLSMFGAGSPAVALGQQSPTAATEAAPKSQTEHGAPQATGESPFLQGLSWQLLASGFYMFNGYRVAGPYNDLNPDPSVRDNYPYTNYMGFGLNFAGGDVGYRGEKFALRLDLRWGTAVPLLTPIAPLKQGYVSWLPVERLALDFGFFDTTFGAEFADEWTNANYTRGALYFLRQPFNHMGIRLGATLSDKLTLRFMVTQGNVLGGTPVAFNEVPAIGWQLSVTPSDLVRFLIGGNHAPNGDNGNKDWESFLDLIVELDIRWLTVILNCSYLVNPHGVDPVTGATEQMVFAYGGSLGLIFDASDHWSVGLRAEHLSGNQSYREFGDPKGDSYRFLWTTTLTVRYKPVEYLVLSLEGRIEGAGTDIYYSRSSPMTLDPETMEEVIQPNRNKYYGAILGVTAHIGN